jgi:uncharacterized OsmC-like protein
MSFMEGSRSQRSHASLNIVVQGKEEMSRDHIELFTREAIEVKVKGADDKLKCF